MYIGWPILYFCDDLKADRCCVTSLCCTSYRVGHILKIVNKPFVNERLLLFIVLCEYTCLLRLFLPSLPLCFCFGCASTGGFFKHKQTYHNFLVAGLLWSDCLHMLIWITNTGRKMFTFAHPSFLSTAIWPLGFWLLPITTDYDRQTSRFQGWQSCKLIWFDLLVQIFIFHGCCYTTFKTQLEDVCWIEMSTGKE